MLLYAKPPLPPGAAPRRYEYGVIDGTHRNIALDELEAMEEFVSDHGLVRTVSAIVFRHDTPRFVMQILGNRTNKEVSSGARGDNLWSSICAMARMRNYMDVMHLKPRHVFDGESDSLHLVVMVRVSNLRG